MHYFFFLAAFFFAIEHHLPSPGVDPARRLHPPRAAL
jgi:hypothetical protein